MRDRAKPTIYSVDTGKYDKLYGSRRLLWPDRPGRMVTLAASLMKPERVLDVGCGDGKNIAFLEDAGAAVDGVDISELAIRACTLRLASRLTKYRGRLIREDARKMRFSDGVYDLVIAYGLYHCLDDSGLAQVHDILVGALKPGGMFAFAAFNDTLPIPDAHQTGELFLRPPRHILTLVEKWRVVAMRFGEITEHHLPLVRLHQHALTWGLFQKV